MRIDSQINAILVLGMPMVGLLMAVLIPLAFSAPIAFGATSLVLCCSGFSMFAVAKMSVIRRGRLVSFGSAAMSPASRRLYRLGYVLMGTGVFLLGVYLKVEPALR